MGLHYVMIILNILDNVFQSARLSIFVTVKLYSSINRKKRIVRPRLFGWIHFDPCARITEAKLCGRVPFIKRVSFVRND